WTTRFSDGGSNCARIIPDTPADWRDEAEGERWETVWTVLEAVNEALEAARRDKVSGGALDARPRVALTQDQARAFEALDAGELFRTSGAELIAADALKVEIATAEDEKCARCWRRMPDFDAQTRLCGRCATVVAGLDAA